MTKNIKLNYVEFPATDIPATKAFFQQAFDWTFEDFGPDYTAFVGQGLDGGFFKSSQRCTTENGGALLVLLSEDLTKTQATVEQSGGVISQPIFDFPGGSRFHFIEPSGNELAVWAKSNE